MSTAMSDLPLPIPGVVSPELDSDTKAIIEKLATGRPLDSDTYLRIRKEADCIRDKIFRKHGVLDIAVPAVRELRNNE